MKSEEMNELLTLPLENIHPNQWNPNVMTQEEFNLLVEDIKTNGQRTLDPIHVRPLGNNQYQIIDGYHRYKALKQLGYKTIRCIIDNVSEDEAKAINYRKNRERGNIDPFKEAQLFYDDWRKGNGQLTQEEIAEKYGISQVDVSRSLNLIKIKEIIPRGIKLPKRILYEISLADKTLQQKIIESYHSDLEKDPPSVREIQRLIKLEKEKEGLIRTVQVPGINFFRIVGGKSRLVRYILPIIPPHLCFVEVFGGAANVLLNKPPSHIEVYNDLDGDLVLLFKTVKNHLNEFMQELDLIPYSRKIHDEWRYIYKEEKDPIKKAAMLYYTLLASFSGKYILGADEEKKWAGWRFGVTTRNVARQYFNRLEKLFLIYERLKNVQIDNLDFEICMKNYDSPTTLFYLDPPYIGTYHKYYGFSWSEDEHRRLRKTLDQIQGKWILSYMEHPLIEELYHDFPTIKIEAVDYSMGGHLKEYRTELIITNYDPNKTEKWIESIKLMV